MDSKKLWLAVPVLVALTACFSASDEAPNVSSIEMRDDMDGAAVAEQKADTGGVGRKGGRPAALKRGASGGPSRAAAAEKEQVKVIQEPSEARVAGGPAADVAEVEQVRDWFPDAFLWEPVVETDSDGVAVVSVRVPDTLTDWRVLGLAHDRTGQQAGALTTFASRLPVYGDPTLPSFLFVGDTVQLPVRAVNGTRAPLTASVAVTAEGALTGAGNASVRLGPNGVGVRTIALVATEAGGAVVQTRVAGGGYTDRSERRLRVHAAGRPVETSKRGALSQELALDLPAPEGEGLSGETLEVVVFPGPMALVQAEVDRLAGGARPALPGASLQAAHHLTVLAERTGATLDEPALRRLRLLGWQRIARQIARADGRGAVDLLLAVSSTDEVGGVEAARPGLVAKTVQAQRSDGTWSWSRSSTLQQVLVQTAMAAMVLPESEVAARLKAEGVAERNLPLITDPYTAAVLIGSGLLRGEAAIPARALVVDSLVRSEQGVPRIAVPDGVVNSWGNRPSETAMLAWTVLALLDDAEAEADRGMLAAELMGSWSAGRGFGAGRADPIALMAVVKAVPGASGPTTLSLVVDGKTVATGAIDPSQPGVPVVLSAPGGTAVLAVDPPVTGLAYTATRTAWAPWPEGGGIDGVEWELDLPESLGVGTTSTVTLSFGAPKGTGITVEQGIPAGMSVNAAALAAQSSVAWSEVLEDRVRVGLKPMPALGAATVKLSVTPQFAGRFTTVPTRLDAGKHGDAVLRPAQWNVSL